MKTKRNTSGAAFRVGALLLFAGAVTGAVADEAVTGEVLTQTQIIQYQPSHAETAIGAEKLYGKLERAAAKVCMLPDRGVQGRAYTSCASNALAKAVKDVGIDAVAAIYVERNRLADKQGIVTIARR